MTDKLVRRHDGNFHWEGVEVLEYKQERSEEHTSELQSQ